MAEITCTRRRTSRAWRSPATGSGPLSHSTALGLAAAAFKSYRFINARGESEFKELDYVKTARIVK